MVQEGLQGGHMAVLPPLSHGRHHGEDVGLLPVETDPLAGSDLHHGSWEHTVEDGDTWQVGGGRAGRWEVAGLAGGRWQG